MKPDASKQDDVLSPPLPGVFSGNLLRWDGPAFRDNSEVSRWLLGRSLADLGGAPLTAPSPKGDRLLAQMMASEALWALGRGGLSSAGWYTRSIERMIAVAAVMHPEIGSDAAARNHPSGLFRDRHEARTVLFSAMAITSQNINVSDNMRYALEQYRAFLEDGSFRPKVYGANGFAIEGNLARFNFILSRAGGDLSRVRRLLGMKVKMSELQAVARKHGINVPGKELAGETVYGSMLFGPKIGNGFYQNLVGNHSPVTIDLWFMRTWGRYTGTLVRDEVTGDAAGRLARGLRRSYRSARLRSLMEKEGLAVDPSSVKEMDAGELLDYARRLRLFWEKLRRRYVEGSMSSRFTARNPARRAAGASNADASALKASLVWPGAAESIVKSLGMPVDSPKNARMRRWIRNVCSMALDLLKDSGYPMTAADLQALLWYPEKEIYGKLTGRPQTRLNLSYDEAIVRVALSEGVSHERIESALRSVGEDGERGPAGPGSPGCGHRRAAGGAGRRTARNVGAAGAGRPGGLTEPADLPSPGMMA